MARPQRMPYLVTIMLTTFRPFALDRCPAFELGGFCRYAVSDDRGTRADGPVATWQRPAPYVVTVWS